MRTYPGPGLGLRPHRGVDSWCSLCCLLLGAAWLCSRPGPPVSTGFCFPQASALPRFGSEPLDSSSAPEPSHPRASHCLSSVLGLLPKHPGPRQRICLAACMRRPQFAGARPRAPSSESLHRCKCLPHSPAAGLDAPAL